MKSAAWTRKKGKNPSGGLNAAGRASYNEETGGTLRPPVKSGDNPRRASFLARMGNVLGPMIDDKGEPTRLALALKARGMRGVDVVVNYLGNGGSFLDFARRRGASTGC